MKMYLDCYPCVLRHALDVARRTTKNEPTQYRMMQAVVRELTKISPQEIPPEITARVHRIIKKASRNSDPYRDLKRVHNEMALRLYPDLKRRVETAADPLLTAVKLSIAGNIIDSGASGGGFDLNQTIEETLQADLVGCDFQTFAEDIRNASHFLYLGDNAGEIVFDRILIEEIQKFSQALVTFVVKAEPILNDATLEDALFVGLDDIADIRSSGYDAPATILEKASEAFLTVWESADLVIAKGQGNYESLSEEEENIFFLLKVKCPALARDIGYSTGDSVLVKAQLHTAGVSTQTSLYT